MCSKLHAVEPYSFPSIGGVQMGCKLKRQWSLGEQVWKTGGVKEKGLGGGHSMSSLMSKGGHCKGWKLQGWRGCPWAGAGAPAEALGGSQDKGHSPSTRARGMVAWGALSPSTGWFHFSFRLGPPAPRFKELSHLGPSTSSAALVGQGLCWPWEQWSGLAPDRGAHSHHGRQPASTSRCGQKRQPCYFRAEWGCPGRGLSPSLGCKVITRNWGPLLSGYAE